MNIVLTGASRGIGFDTALLLSQTSLHQVIVISRNEEALKELASMAAHQNIYPVVADLTTELPTAVLAIKKRFASVERLINNAGLLINKPFDELGAEDWKKLFQVNVFAPVNLTQALLPYMNKGAHIVNIGSMGGFQGSSKFPGLSAYSASKAALANFSECLAEELKERQISVNCLALGAVQTAMLAEAFPDYQAPMSSQQMAKLLAHFTMEGHQFYNGKVLPVSSATP